MTWIQAFNQAYPGALQYLQAGGYVANPAGGCVTRINDRGVRTTCCPQLDGSRLCEMVNEPLEAYADAHGWGRHELRLSNSGCPRREDFLPYCDPCTQPLCGDAIPTGCAPFGPEHPDCQRAAEGWVDPHARERAFREGYAMQAAWQRAGGDGLAPRDWKPGMPVRGQNCCYPGVAPAIGLSPAAYAQPARGALVPNPHRRSHRAARARNFMGGVGAIGPAIGLSPLVYGVPFPGYPSLAQQPKVGVSPAEARQWEQVYAAQQRDRLRNPCAQESPWPPTASYGTGQYGSQYGPNQNPELCHDLDTGEGVPCSGAPVGTCVNNRGCIPIAVDCATGQPLDLPLECPTGWIELDGENGDVVGCLPGDQGCKLVWTYQADACPTGMHHHGWHTAEDGEDIARVCCPYPPPMGVGDATLPRQPNPTCVCTKGFVHPKFGWVCTEHSCIGASELDIAEQYVDVQKGPVAPRPRKRKPSKLVRRMIARRGGVR